MAVVAAQTLFPETAVGLLMIGPLPDGLDSGPPGFLQQGLDGVVSTSFLIHKKNLPCKIH
jgi:hypothetical protein